MPDDAPRVELVDGVMFVDIALDRHFLMPADATSTDELTLDKPFPVRLPIAAITP